MEYIAENTRFHTPAQLKNNRPFQLRNLYFRDLYQSITIDGTRYSHIVNPDTALGLTTRKSATVIGPDCTHTDALATALCVDPTLQFPKFKTLVIYEHTDGTLKRIQSENWSRK